VNKKKQKNFEIYAAFVELPVAKGAKVFWFFFSKKNRLPQVFLKSIEFHNYISRQIPKKVRPLMKLNRLLLLAGIAQFALSLPAAALQSGARTGIRDLDTPATLVKAPDRVVLIALANAGARLVAVGEHGVIAVSDDNGRIWRQAMTPVDVTLTSVAFADAEHGWAAGHYGVILYTADGGAHWREQLNGVQANQLTLQAALAAASDGDTSPGAKLAMRRAQHFVDDGPDKPFLTILPLGPQSAIVFGAYRMAMRTDDGGRDWRDWSLHVGDPRSHNLYAAIDSADGIYIAAETGLVFRSSDQGASFPPTAMPGGASLFAAAPTGNGGIFVCGVAGSAFTSADDGKDWQASNMPTAANLTGARLLASGLLVVAAESGQVFVSRDHGRNFSPLPDIQPMSLYDLTQAANGDLVMVGCSGTATISAAELPSTGKGT
jgi:photosystem II stability/assembly factor-like uncharacterized protein